MGIITFVAASPVLVGACIAESDAAASGIGILALKAACRVGLIAPGGVNDRADLACNKIVAIRTAYTVARIVDVGVLQITTRCLCVATCITGLRVGTIAIVGI